MTCAPERRDGPFASFSARRSSPSSHACSVTWPSPGRPPGGVPVRCDELTPNGEPPTGQAHLYTAAWREALDAPRTNRLPVDADPQARGLGPRRRHCALAPQLRWRLRRLRCARPPRCAPLPGSGPPAPFRPQGRRTGRPARQRLRAAERSAGRASHTPSSPVSGLPRRVVHMRGPLARRSTRRLGARHPSALARVVCAVLGLTGRGAAECCSPTGRDRCVAPA
jgi:hypothetical protein